MMDPVAAPPSVDVEQRIVDTIKTLALDAVERAKSGHPGLPMGGADFATVLWTRHLRVDPAWPEWPGRDRFVLSAGHGSMLLYSLLHLAGFDLPLSELERFRQWGSKTPGHPEVRHTPGVETTTGPLGQGFANAVGMALAERLVAARFPNGPDGPEGHRTFVFASDGDLMEGLAAEAASLAGHWGLSRLIVWYDANRVTIDGSTDLAFTEDVGARFRAYGWHVVGPIDGHDREAIDRALRESLAEKMRPSLIVGATKLAHGSPRFEGSSRAHGAPLGEEEVRAVKERLGLDPGARFRVPEAVRSWFGGWRKARAAESATWLERRAAFRADHAAEAKAWEAALADALPADLLADPPSWKTGEAVPTRKAGREVVQVAARQVPWLIAGSADLFESNLTAVAGAEPVAAPGYAGRNVFYGVREHAMAAIVNGLVLHGGVRAFGSTFLVFSDYLRPSLRLAAIMGIPAVHVFTHDSVWVGEDGPTHQPVEHLDALRVIPNVHVVRPADARETVWAWGHALRRREGPTALVLTRQPVPVLERVPSIEGVGGAGVVYEPDRAADLVLAATGSEVSLCVDVAIALRAERIAARVVSLPCLETFAGAADGERERILPAAVPRLFVEAGTGLSFAPWMRPGDAFHGIRRFGASAPGSEVAAQLGLTVVDLLLLAKRLAAAGRAT
ncbi:MAG: transketolase [Candidatus Eiseniibacteriota bacterium]